jgi:flagellar basal-body rod modification protein FlgD
MSTIDNSNLTQQLESLGIATSAKTDAKSKELGQEQFLELMITQLKHQDPFKPMENGEFITQIAQFSSVSGIKSLQDSFSSFANSMQSNMALQASSMVGRSVLVPSSDGMLTPEGLKGSAELTNGADRVTLGIYSQAGELVRQIHYGIQPAGMMQFEWDGLDSHGDRMVDGKYSIRAEANSGNQTISLGTYVVAPVESVTIGSGGNGLTLNLGELGSEEFSKVKQIS